ncbi:MAG: phosphoglucosamine mutase [Sulfuricurvum sp. PC08-66]|nr:MAG: phosphoglucosamine mutase [Sulfuricurvum sp. PC08-66]
MKLFGTDGVRGEAGSYLTPMLAMRLAMAAGIYFKAHSTTNKILIGKDTRKSGYMIENAIVSGLTAIGYDVIQIGPMPTPAVAFITENMRCDAGIMISASHNAFEDNGIKFFDAHGNKFSQEVEAHIEAIYADNAQIDAALVTGKAMGAAKRIDDVIGRYIVQLKSSFPKHLTLHGLRIILDTANGAAYKVAPTILEELGAEVITIHNRPNGYNINDECGALHTKELQEKVRELRADIGIALDGDADRLVVVDEQGEVVDGDQLMGALAHHLKTQNRLKGDAMVATVMSNMGLQEYLGRHDIQLYRSDVGDKNVLEVMMEKKINFGGEQSGHIIMHDYAKTGDGLAAALQTLALLLTHKGKASKLLRPFALYPQKLVNIKVSHKPPLGSIEGLASMLSEIEKLGMRHLIRYSGTENKLRLLLEGKDGKLLESTMQRLEAFCTKALA